MKTRDLTENLRLLHGLRVGGEPSRAWALETRRTLLRRIRAAEPRRMTAAERILDILRLSGFAAAARLTFRSAGAMALAVVVLFGGFSVGVSASYASVPGDALYGLKRATERAQLALAPDADTRARLQVDFVGRRVEEVTRIAQAATIDGGSRLEAAVANLRGDVAAVQTQMASLRKDSPAAAVEVAKLVDRKAEEYHTALRRTDAVSPASTPAIQEARNIVADASVKAVAVIIEGRGSGSSSLSEEEIAAKLGDKIRSVSDRLNDLEQTFVTSTSSVVAVSANQAKVALDEAKTLVEHNDLSAALIKVIEGKELVKAAEQIASETAATSSTDPVPSTTVALPAGTVTTGMTEPAPTAVVSSTPETTEQSSMLDGTVLQPASSTFQIIIR